MAFSRRLALATAAVAGALSAALALILPEVLQVARGARPAPAPAVTAPARPAAAPPAAPALPPGRLAAAGRAAPTALPAPAGARKHHLAGTAGMVAAIDPETGGLGAPSPAQRRALAAAARVAPVEPSAPQPAVERHPDGSYSATLDSRYMEYAVVRIGPDGKAVAGCVQGARAAESAVTDSLARPAETRPAAREER